MLIYFKKLTIYNKYDSGEVKAPTLRRRKTYYLYLNSVFMLDYNISDAPLYRISQLITSMRGLDKNPSPVPVPPTHSSELFAVVRSRIFANTFDLSFDII